MAFDAAFVFPLHENVLQLTELGAYRRRVIQAANWTATEMEVAMKKAFLPVVAAVLLAGVAGLSYAPKAEAHFDCTGAYNDCIASGEDPGSCSVKEAVCWSTNHWPEGFTAAKASESTRDAG